MTPPEDEPTGSRGRRGPFAVGDLVQITDPKGHPHTVRLEPGKKFHTHRGALAHDDLIGQPEGSVVAAVSGTQYVAVRPRYADYVLGMPRGAAVVYPKDTGAILVLGDVFPGARVLEAGAGSGSLTCALLRAVGDRGRVTSYEVRPDFAETARANVERFFGGEHPAWTLRVGDVAEVVAAEAGGEAAAGAAAEPGTAPYDRAVLDMLAPWEVLPAVSDVLAPGGVLVCYVATTTQLSRVVEAIREHGGYAEPECSETLSRGWHVDGLAVRPDHRMVAHTAFLVAARRMAPGFRAPQRQRKPSKGAAAYAAQRQTGSGTPE